MIRELIDRGWRRTWRGAFVCAAVSVTAVVLALLASLMAASAGERALPSSQPTAQVHPWEASDDDLRAALQGSVESLSVMTSNLPQPRDGQTPPSQDARWTWPLSGPEVVMAGFDGPPKPWLPGHRGIDLAGLEGAPVRAVADGVISYVGVVNGVAVVSVLHEDGVLSTYQPVLGGPPRASVVARGGLLGTLAATGSHCWPLNCLHLGARIHKTYVDPMLYLRRWDVSLLPSGPR